MFKNKYINKQLKLLTEGICRSSKNVQQKRLRRSDSGLVLFIFIAYGKLKSFFLSLSLKERHIQDAECFKETPFRIP